MCAKLVLNQRKYDSSKEALIELHCLPNKCRISFKIFTYMNKQSVGQSLEYLKELLSKQQQTINCILPEVLKAVTMFLLIKGKLLVTKFSTIGLKLWNELHIYIKHSKSIDDFKNKFKNYFFRDFYALF